MMITTTNKQAQHRNNDWMDRLTGILSTPLPVDGYLEMINPLWSRHLRGRVESVERHGDRAISLEIRPNRHWQGHQAGQYVQVGVDVDGVRQWRSYSITSPDSTASADRNDTFSITVGHLQGGKVSGWLMRNARVGMALELKPAGGDFVLPQMLSPLLLVSGGTGITPMMGMLRQLAKYEMAYETMPAVTLLHYVPDYQSALFIDELNDLEARFPWLTVHFSLTRGQPVADDLSGHFSAKQLAAVCPDWTERELYVCGPAALMESVEVLHQQYRDAGKTSHGCHREAFAPSLKVNTGSPGGKVEFFQAGKTVQAGGDTSLLEVAESAGLLPEHGCRMGICQCCITRLEEGQVRDLRTGEVFGEPGDDVKICVCAAAGDVKLEL